MKWPIPHRPYTQARLLLVILSYASTHIVQASSNDELARKLGLETLQSENSSVGNTRLATGSSDLRAIAIITEPYSAVTLAAPVIGQVEKRTVAEGDLVKPGDVVMILENRSETIEADRAKLIWQDKSGLEASKLREEILKNLFESSKMLYEKSGSVSFEELQKSELDYQLSKAERTRIEVQEQQEKFDYELAKSVREKRFIKAAIAGIVTKIHLEEGEGCEINQPLVEIVDATRGLVVANVAEFVGRKLKPGQTVNLSLRMGKSLVNKQGKIFFISPVVDAASSLMEVKVEFDNKDGRIRLGVAGTLDVI